MNKLVATALVHASLALGALVVAGCSAEEDVEEDELSTSSAVAAGARIWQFNRECGTAETGACPARPACPDLPNAKACGAVGDRCVTGPNPSGRRKVFACVPTYAYSWGYNGNCEGTGCTSRPACPTTGGSIAGAVCTNALDRCVNGDRVFVCLPNGKDQFVFNGYCGKNGGPACASIPDACPAVPQGVAGLACTVGSRCKAMSPDGISGKVFSCVSR